MFHARKFIHDQPYYSAIFFIFLWYGLLVICGYIVRFFPSVSFGFIISETGTNVIVSLSAKDLSDLILIGPVFSLGILYYYRQIKQFNRKNQEDADPKIDKDSFFLYVFLFLLVISNSTHIIVNEFSGILKEMSHSESNPELAQLYFNSEIGFLAYFWDEIFGHLGIVIGFFGICYVIIRSLLQYTFSEELITNLGKIAIYIIGLLFGIGQMYAYIDGQCAPVVLILIIWLNYWFIWRWKQKGIKILHNPLIQYLLVILITSMIYLIWVIIIFGTKSYYPYFFQWSEL